MSCVILYAWASGVSKTVWNENSFQILFITMLIEPKKNTVLLSLIANFTWENEPILECYSWRLRQTMAPQPIKVRPGDMS